jgi:hypothetical protein
MSEPKWTRGPWTVGDDGIVDNQNGFPIKLATGWKEDAWQNDDADEESKANARLIASAPELYTALETARKILREFCSLYSFNAEVDSMLSPEEVAGLRLVKDGKSAFEIIDAALAKARVE